MVNITGISSYSRSDDFYLNNNNGNQDCWILKITSNGDTLWSKSFGTLNTEASFDLIETLDSSLLLTGNYNQDLFLLKLDQTGDSIWQMNYGGSGSDIGRSIIEYSNKDFYIMGYSYSTDGVLTQNKGLSDTWIINVIDTTPIIITGINHLQVEKNKISVYPNPTKSIINIDFNELTGNYSIKFFNSLNQEIYSTLVGTKENTVDLNSLNDGIYYLQIVDSKNSIVNTQLIFKL